MGQAQPGAKRSHVAAARGSSLLDAIERRLGISANGLIVVGFVVFGWVLGRRIASRAMLLLVYGGVVLLIACYAIGRRKLSVEARRSDLPGRVREGQVVEVNLELKAKRRVSTVVLEEQLHTQLGDTVRLPVPLLPAGEETSHLYTFRPKLRGMYTVGPLVAMWSDPFGLTKHRMVVAEATPLIVHPSTEAVSDRVISREWEDPPVRPPVSKPWPTGFEFYALRDYVSGDDPRRINWRATAKSLDLETGAGRYLVRESEQGITDHVSIFLDTDAEWHSPGTPSETFETGVKAAASLGVKHLKDGFSVTLEANGARLAANLRGETSRLPFLDKLAAVERERVPLARAIDRLLTTGRRNSHNVIVTPHLDPASATRLRLVMDRGTSLLLVVLLWEDSDLLTLHRAGSLGCNVVELNPKMALDRVFQRVVGMARR